MGGYLTYFGSSPQAQPKQTSNRTHPHVYICRPRAHAGVDKHWAVVYCDVKFELKNNNGKCLLDVSRLEDPRYIKNNLNGACIITDEGHSDESLAMTLEAAKKIVRSNDTYKWSSNDCQTFAVHLVSFMCKDSSITRAKVNSRASLDVSRVCRISLTMEVLRMNIRRYDQVMRDETGRERKDFYFKICTSATRYTWKIEEKQNHANNNRNRNNDNMAVAQAESLASELNHKFILQLSYCVAFLMHKQYYKLKFGLSGGDGARRISIMTLLRRMVVPYLLRVTGDVKGSIPRTIREFMQTENSISGVYKAAAWFDMDIGLELCRKIRHSVHFNQTAVDEINSSMSPVVETSDGNVVSINGNFVLSTLGALQADIQVVYWKYVMLKELQSQRSGGRITLGTFNVHNMDPVQFEFLVCCLQLQSYSNDAAALLKMAPNKLKK